MSSGIFAGSFDPFHKGHLYVVKVASRLFNRLIICISTNVEKTRAFSKELMKEGIEATLKSEGITNCEVVCYDGFITDLAKEIAKPNEEMFIVRGMRSSKDFDYEEAVAKTYYKMGKIQTIYINSGSFVDDGIQSQTSSTLVRKLLNVGMPISKYVPPEIEKLLIP